MPNIPDIVPKNVIAPERPDSTFLKVVINLGLCLLNNPISVDIVSPVAIDIDVINGINRISKFRK